MSRVVYRKHPQISAEDEATINRLLSAEEPFFYVKSGTFYHQTAEKRILGCEEVDMSHTDAIWNVVFSDADSSISEKSLKFTAKQEKNAFSQFNYARYRVSRFHSKVRKRNGLSVNLTWEEKEEMLRWYHSSERLRVNIIRANIGLSLAMLKKSHLPVGAEYADALSEANMALARAVNKFNFTRGFKFSTYACRAILKSIYSYCRKFATYRSRYLGSELLDGLSRDKRATVPIEEIQHREEISTLLRVIECNEAELSDQELKILRFRFPLNPLERPRTLEEVGADQGLTKERIRQIQKGALRRIKEVLVEEGLE